MELLGFFWFTSEQLKQLCNKYFPASMEAYQTLYGSIQLFTYDEIVTDAIHEEISDLARGVCCCTQLIPSDTEPSPTPLEPGLHLICTIMAAEALIIN